MIEPGNPGSNQGPLDLQSNALPTELTRQTPRGARTLNLPIRSRTPYPLGHRGKKKSSVEPDSNQRPQEFYINYNPMLYQLSYQRILRGGVLEGFEPSMIYAL